MLSWLLKRSCCGIYHWMGLQNLARYLHEFCSRNDVRLLLALDRISASVLGGVGRSLSGRELVG